MACGACAHKSFLGVRLDADSSGAFPSLHLRSRLKTRLLRKSTAVRAQAEAGDKRVFVAGASGRTGKKIVSKLVAEGFRVRAGVRDVSKARNTLPKDEAIEIVAADVTLEPAKLAKLVGNVDAIICASAFTYSLDLLAPWKVDYQGTVNLVDACRRNSIKKIVLISSILVNGAAWGQLLNPAYLVLNAFGLTLIAKLQAENYIRKSGINYTIIRPGGLSEDKPKGNIVMAKEDQSPEISLQRLLLKLSSVRRQVTRSWRLCRKNKHQSEAFLSCLLELFDKNKF